MKKYNKESNLSYSLGIYPTIELINYKSEKIIKVILSKKIDKEIEIKIIKLCQEKNIVCEYDDLSISKISNKENCYVVGVFKKYVDDLQKNESHVVLVNPSNMGNLGTIIRTMLGFNYRNLAIIVPTVDHFNPQVIRSSMGAIFNINIEVFISFDEYKNKYNNHTIYTFMLNGKNNINDVKKENPNSLVFGNESSGLDSSFSAYESIYIKHNDLIDSLNITIAVGIGLYEFNK